MNCISVKITWVKITIFLSCVNVDPGYLRRIVKSPRCQRVPWFGWIYDGENCNHKIAYLLDACQTRHEEENVRIVIAVRQWKVQCETKQTIRYKTLWIIRGAYKSAFKKGIFLVLINIWGRMERRWTPSCHLAGQRFLIEENAKFF